MLHEPLAQDLKHGLLPTPPLPEDFGKVDLSENARQVLIRRYVRRGETASQQRALRGCFGGWLTM